MASAAAMLKVQHMPRSVGNVLKMAEQGTGSPLHSQYLRSPFWPSYSDVTPFTSKQGSFEYHRIDRMARADLFLCISLNSALYSLMAP